MILEYHLKKGTISSTLHSITDFLPKATSTRTRGGGRQHLWEFSNEHKIIDMITNILSTNLKNL